MRASTALALAAVAVGPSAAHVARQTADTASCKKTTVAIL